MLSWAKDVESDLSASTHLYYPNLATIRRCLKAVESELRLAQCTPPVKLIERVEKKGGFQKQVIRVAIQYGLENGTLALDNQSLICKRAE